MNRWSSPTKQRRKRRLDCERKVRYLSEGAADLAMQSMQAQGRAAPECSSYYCDICNGFHWGHPSGLRGGVGSGNSHVQLD